MSKAELRRALFRRARAGFPWGAAGVYLVFLVGNRFSIPAPEGGAAVVVTAALAARWGDPAMAALVQFFWSGLLGAVLALAGLPFQLERRAALWSGAHLLLTAAALSLAGWRCCWFPYRETWLFCLGATVLCYLLFWAVRWIGWRNDLRLLRRAAGLPPEARETAKRLPYLLLTAGVELALPWLLRLLDPPDVPVLTGLFYPFLLLPLFCFAGGCAAGRRCRWPWVLLYAALCGLLTLPDVFLLYNYTALFQAWTAGIAALLGGLLGLLRRKIAR